MEPAHFNPKELDVLNKAQGGPVKLGKRLHDLSGFERIISDPKIEKLLMKEYEHHAKGGRIGDMLRQADDMRKHGRNGDSEMAMIGPNTKRVFNKILHGGSQNPTTKAPEYFNLGGMVKGIGHTISKGVSSVGKAVAPVAQGLSGFASNALPGAIAGGLVGGPEGALAGGMESGISGMMSPQQQQMGQSPSMPQSLGQMGQQFMNSSYGQKAMGSGANIYNQANQAYQGATNSNMGRAALGAYNGYTGNNYQPPSSLAGAGREAMNTPMGQNIQQHGRDMYNRADQGYQNMHQQGQEAMQRGHESMHNMHNQMEHNPHAQALRGAYNGYRGAQSQDGYGQ